MAGAKVELVEQVVGVVRASYGCGGEGGGGHDGSCLRGGSCSWGVTTQVSRIHGPASQLSARSSSPPGQHTPSTALLEAPSRSIEQRGQCVRACLLQPLARKQRRWEAPKFKHCFEASFLNRNSFASSERSWSPLVSLSDKVL